MPISVLVCRHGSTVNNDAGVYIGQQDIPLDAGGKEQAQELAQFLQQFPIKLIVCSPLSRTMETAQVIAQRFGLQPEPSDRLIPWNVGFMTGQPKAPLKEVRKYFIEHPDEPVPGGESFTEFQDKFEIVLHKAIEFSEKQGSIVAIVAHSNQITATEKLINGEAMTADQSYMVQPGGVVAVVADPDGYKAMPIFRKSDEAEVGTKASGYSEDGPFHCEDCIHLTEPGQPLCIHPEILKDPELQDKLTQSGSQPAIEINLEQGCCRFVNPGKDKDNPQIIS
jgi:2,3-bisphosphoglycerate-dependent phosphoglycerate mutase